MLDGARAAVSFLTVLPSGRYGLDDMVKGMYLFPAVGLGIGVCAGALGFILLWAGAPPLVMGLLVTASIAALTGLHHTDGLADYADGMMARGTRQKRINAMRDKATGTAGTCTIILYYMGMTVALSYADALEIITILVISECAAKLAMVVSASFCRAAAPGSGSIFVEAARDKKIMLGASAIAITAAFALGGAIPLAAMGAGIAASLFISAVSMRTFGGITGDVLGACNEIARLSSVAVFILL